MIRAHIPPSALSQASLESSIQNQLPILKNDHKSTKILQRLIPKSNHNSKEVETDATVLSVLNI